MMAMWFSGIRVAPIGGLSEQPTDYSILAIPGPQEVYPPQAEIESLRNSVKDQWLKKFTTEVHG